MNRRSPIDSVVATTRGDDGTTGLLYGGERIQKDDPIRNQEPEATATPKDPQQQQHGPKEPLNWEAATRKEQE